MLGCRVVLYNRYARHSNVSSVRIENAAGGNAIADYLIDNGHRRLAFVAGSPIDPTSGDRERGFVDRLNALGRGNMIRIDGDFTFEGGRRAIGELWARGARPTAIFAASDLMAAGVMDGARYDLSLRIPEDLSVVGFDDLPIASWPSYGLTTVRQPVEEMAQQALDMLIHRIDDASARPQTRLVEGSLIVRGSTRSIV